MSSSSTSPVRYIFSNVLFSPMYEAIILEICFVLSSLPRPEVSVPALLDTAVMPVMSGLLTISLMSVSGTPQRPKPPQRSVLLGFMSLRASEAEGYTLLISARRAVAEKDLAKTALGWGRES